MNNPTSIVTSVSVAFVSEDERQAIAQREAAAQAELDAAIDQQQQAAAAKQSTEAEARKAQRMENYLRSVKKAIEGAKNPTIVDEKTVVGCIHTTTRGTAGVMRAYPMSFVEKLGFKLTSANVAQIALSDASAREFERVTGLQAARLMPIHRALLKDEERAEKDAERQAIERTRKANQRFTPGSTGFGLSSHLSPEAREEKRAKKAEKEALKRTENARLSAQNAASIKKATAEKKAQQEANAAAKKNGKGGKR